MHLLFRLFVKFASTGDLNKIRSFHFSLQLIGVTTVALELHSPLLSLHRLSPWVFKMKGQWFPTEELNQTWQFGTETNGFLPYMEWFSSVLYHYVHLIVKAFLKIWVWHLYCILKNIQVLPQLGILFICICLKTWLRCIRLLRCSQLWVSWPSPSVQGCIPEGMEPCRVKVVHVGRCLPSTIKHRVIEEWCFDFMQFPQQISKWNSNIFQ